MDSREDPRISLASVQDWHRLKANYMSSLVASLEEDIHSHGLVAERDALLTHTNQYIDRVFKIAQPNLRVNGHNYESLDESEYNTEPFDEALDRRIWSLADTRLQWQKRLAETRRSVPREIEATMLDLLNEQRAVDAGTAALLEGDASEDMQLEYINDPLARYSHIQEGFQKTMVALGEELDQTTASQEERAERARIVEGEVKALVKA